MRILVTGARGFVGRHVTRHLTESGHTPLLLDVVEPAQPEANSFTADLREAEKLADLVGRLKPDACVHLGGIAFVPMGWTDPQLVFSCNVIGTINLLESFRKHAPAAKILVVTSAEVYGIVPGLSVLSETSPMEPSGLYGVSKMAADLIALLYARRYSMPVMTARPLNHIGPGQSSRFVTVAFAEQLVDIQAGRREATIKAGNLETERDFTDVRDVARAYRLLIEKGKAGEAYNIASGKRVKIQTILRLLCKEAGLSPRIVVDPALYRPVDHRPAIDIAKICEQTGWQPEIPLERSLEDILDHVRKVRKGQD